MSILCCKSIIYYVFTRYFFWFLQFAESMIFIKCESAQKWMSTISKCKNLATKMARWISNKKEKRFDEFGFTL